MQLFHLEHAKISSHNMTKKKNANKNVIKKKNVNMKLARDACQSKAGCNNFPSDQFEDGKMLRFLFLTTSV